MAADERTTVAALDAARSVFRSGIESNQGRVIDMTGDSVLAVFETATGAVSAALAVQQELNASSSAVPEDRRMHFRIGVHLGDVIEKADGTVYGDGVNIAARLQGLAEPGGITVSDSIRNAVRGKVTASFVDQGEQQVKNIGHPVRAFRVRTQGIGIPEGARSSIHSTRQVRLQSRHSIIVAVSVVLLLVGIASAWLWSRQDQTAEKIPPTAVSKAVDSKSIAVLPFTNMSDDKDTTYFADGVHEDLLMQLALLGELKVVSRTSVMDYRNSTKNMRQIGAELGVGSLVEGSVRRAGNQVRVTAQLIDARSDKHLWAKSYDRELKDIFAVQSELATEIAQALKVSLNPQDRARINRKATDNLAAYDLLLRHQDLVNRSAGTYRTFTSVKDRIDLLSKAVEIDPNFALAWARLGAEHARAYDYRIDRSVSRQSLAKQAIDRALALAPEDIEVRVAEGVFHHHAQKDYGRAAQSYEGVLRMAPNNIEALLALADVRSGQLLHNESATLLERVLAVDVRNLPALVHLSNLLVRFRRFDRALALQQQMINIRPGDIELQGKYYLIEYQRSSTWDAFDKWRSTLPPGAEREGYRVWKLDLDRACARRDFDAALRILDAIPAGARSVWDIHSLHLLRVPALFAKGDRSRAVDFARNKLRAIASEIRGKPDDVDLLTVSSGFHALLGERKAAFDALRRAQALAAARADQSDIESTRRLSLYLHAMLGDREQALKELANQLKLPGSSPNIFRIELEFASLWNDPAFQAIVNDSANNDPLPLDLKYSVSMEN